MNTHAFEKKLHSLKARFGLQLFVLAAVVCTSWIVTDHANAVYILTGPEDAAIVLNEEEVREGEMSSQLVYLSSGQSGYDMALTAGQEVTVTHDGSTVTAKATGGFYDKVDLGIVKYHFEIGAGKENFSWG